VRLDVDACSVVFWIGDLNYRIDIESEDCKKMITKRQLDQLYKTNDQVCECVMCLHFAVYHAEPPWQAFCFITGKWTGTAVWYFEESSAGGTKSLPWCDICLTLNDANIYLLPSQLL